MRRFLVLWMVLSPLMAGQTKPQRTMTQEKMCADQARKAFAEFYGWKKNGKDYIFTSHYDAQTTTCYIWVHGVTGSEGHTDVMEDVFDAFENRTYAYYLKFMDTGRVMECYIRPREKKEIPCSDVNEFDELVDKYFGVGRD